MIIQRGSGWPPLTVEFGPPPADPSKVLARMERARRNSQWLQAHWPDLLPQALGKYVAVAGEEAFIADSPEEAWTWAEQAHPEDDAATVRYVNPHQGPKIYASGVSFLRRVKRWMRTSRLNAMAGVTDVAFPSR